MKLASSLALKWLGGIAALGGAGGGLLSLHKNGYLSGGGNETKDKGDRSNGKDVLSKPKTTTDNTLGQQPPQPLPSNPPGVASPTLPVDNHQSDADILITTSDEGLVVPLRCENENCELDENEIKKIKFQALEGGTGEVSVSPTSDLNISLTVEGSGDNKRYVFKNDSDELTISKGSSHTLKLPQNKTRFVVDNKSLKKLEIGNYGLPKDCETNNSCHLTSSDLETIKFSDFTEEENGPFITVEGLNNKETISLTIEEGKYIFKSPSSVTITQNTTTKVELEEGETEFKVDNGKLKKIVLGDFGLPEDCKFDDASNPKTCSLSSRDLEKIKFKDMGTNISISGLKNAEKVSLEIKKANDSSFPDDRKYVFTPKGSSDVAISGTQTITLSKGVENTFKKERGGDTLVALPKRIDPSEDVKALDTKISGLGLPNSCTFSNKASGTEKSIECELTSEELKALKFSEGDVSKTENGLGIESGIGDPKTYKIKIEEPKNNEGDYGTQKIRVIFLNKGENDWSSDLVIGFNGDSSPITIANKTDTEFKINKQNKLEKAWKDSTLSEQVGLKCPKDSSTDQTDCTLKDEGGSIKVFIDGEAKEFKPTSKEDIENNMKYETDKGEYGQGFKFNLKEKISGSVGSDPETTFELVKDSYEIRRINDHGWRLTKKESIFGG